ncbi:hypothetical protein [Roseobacter sp. HKCCA0434]|uniref:hypothetical protein n=1 Tax=Roseobacter sp. HKCCA0434 TaxID=3079297 RepID=UPI00290585AD|nr:hypothetical protein [Roseobacter sp. HKCCA0434]
MAFVHMLIALVLTALTQVGGVAWLAALVARGTGPARALRFAAAFVTLYAGLSVTAWAVAPAFGRVALPCLRGEVRAYHPLYCAANRSYASFELAAQLAAAGVPLRTLDAGFPLPMPMLPHLSHGGGRAVDIALPLERGALPWGYWAFVQPGADDPQPCTGQDGPLRWDMAALQPPEVVLDAASFARQVRALLDQDLTILIEPHLEADLPFESDALRFQGCSAARHDDHIHVRL